MGRIVVRVVREGARCFGRSCFHSVVKRRSLARLCVMHDDQSLGAGATVELLGIE